MYNSPVRRAPWIRSCIYSRCAEMYMVKTKFQVNAPSGLYLLSFTINLNSVRNKTLAPYYLHDQCQYCAIWIQFDITIRTLGHFIAPDHFITSISIYCIKRIWKTILWIIGAWQTPHSYRRPLYLSVWCISSLE